MKVLYFIGKGRSGTTLLDNVLGQIDGFVSTGEITKLWTWGFQSGWSCGCGRPVPECPFWRDVLDAGFGRDELPDVDAVVALQERVLRWPNVPRLLAASRITAARWDDLEEFADITGRVYRGVAEVSGARVIVDSSKWPAAPTSLGIVPDTDVYLLHLVRDPRAVAQSWRRRKAWTDREDGEEMPRYSVWYSMASYWARNVVAEILAARRSAQALRLRYEDFSAAPRETLESLAHFVGEELPRGFLEEGPVVRLSPTHTAGGNPNRLTVGEVTIRSDERWRAEQSRFDRLVATATGWPLMLRYRYPVRLPRAAPHTVTSRGV